MTDHFAPTWRWRSIALPVPFGGGAAMAMAADHAHLAVLAARPDGGAVDHVIVSIDGTVQSRAPLPLVSVSGAASGPAGYLVTGAGQATGGPAVCAVEAATGAVTTIDLPADEPLTAWPVPVSADPPRVVWATGRHPATVRCATLAAGGLTAEEVVELDTVVWSVQALAAGAGLEVLCRTPEGAVLVRVGERATEFSSCPGESWLFPGAVLSPRDIDRVDVWETATGAHYEIVLPPPPPDGPARAATPMIAAPDLLVWATHVPDSRLVDAGASVARTISARGWVAPLDRVAWRVGPATELPTAAVGVAVLGGELVVAGSSGIWIGAAMTEGPTGPRAGQPQMAGPG